MSEEVDPYLETLMKKYHEMEELMAKGKPEHISMIEVMQPAQNLYNYLMMKLTSKWQQLET